MIIKNLISKGRKKPKQSDIFSLYQQDRLPSRSATREKTFSRSFNNTKPRHLKQTMQFGYSTTQSNVVTQIEGPEDQLRIRIRELEADNLTLLDQNLDLKMTVKLDKCLLDELCNSTVQGMRLEIDELKMALLEKD